MNKLAKIFIFFSICFMPFGLADNLKQKESYKNDYLYSQEYFDYLIECASIDKQNEEDEIKAQKKLEEKQAKNYAKADNKSDNENIDEEIPLDTDILAEEIIQDSYEPFKLHIESFDGTNKYKESYKQVDTKILIPINDNFSYMTDMSKSRSKYNSQDYKILAGAEYALFDFLSFSGGLETNYRGLDQNPNSRKLYITPKLSLGDKVSIIFPNKINIHNHTTDHDIGLNVSPFKSKFMDFGVYGGITRSSAGKVTESINFSTNWYLF